MKKQRVWTHWPLAVKLAAIITVFVVAAVVTVTLVNIRSQQTAFKSELEQQADVLLDGLGVAASNALYRNDVDYLQNLMLGLGDAQMPTLSDVRIYDEQGRVVVDSRVEDAVVYALQADPLGQRLIQANDYTFDWQDSALTAGKSIRVGNQALGAISVVISTDQLQVKMDAARNQGLAVALAAVVVGGVLATLIGRTFTARLRAVTDATTRIASGNLTYQLPVDRRDEVGQLMTAFNEMSRRLNEGQEQLAAKNAALVVEVGERKKAEGELARLVLDLQAANERVKESSRLKSEFLATMSHELRTPLNAIIGFSGIMLEGISGDIDDNARQMIKGIYDSSNHLLSLINSVLDISKIEAGRLQIASAPLSVREMAAGWQAQADVLSQRKGLAFELKLAPGIPDLLIGDQERISQIAINLLSNAVKFTDTGKVSMDVAWQEKQLVMEVRDTGIGIPPHAIGYIFDEFRQVDSSPERLRGGTGLGLAIVQRLSRAMGGGVQVTSKLGEGSVFTVKLPLGTVEATNKVLQETGKS